MFIPKYVPSGNTWRENRRLLLTYSYFIKQLVRRIREDIGISDYGEGGFKTQGELVKWRGEIIKEVKQRDRRRKGNYKFIELLSGIYNALTVAMKPMYIQLEKFSYLDLDADFVEQLVLASEDSLNFKLGDSYGIRVVMSMNDPINEAGVWLKWEPNLSEEEIKMRYTEAESIATKSYLADILYQKSPVSDIERKRTNLTKHQLCIYKTIEELLERVYESGDDKVTLVKALDELRGDLKKHKESTKSVYEDLKRRYKLPSHTNVNKIGK